MFCAENRNALLKRLVGFTLLAAAPGVCLADWPMGWVGGGEAAGYEFSKDADLKHAGEASAVIRSTADMPAQPGAFAQLLKADKYRGKRLRLSGFVKPEGVEGWGGLWMRIDTADSVGVEYGNTKNRAATGTSDWAEYEIVLNVPPEAIAISLGGTLVGKGKLWIDDLSLDVVGNDVAATGFPVRGQPRKQQQAKINAPEELVNGGFEK